MPENASGLNNCAGMDFPRTEELHVDVERSLRRGLFIGARGAVVSFGCQYFTRSVQAKRSTRSMYSRPLPFEPAKS